MKKAIRRLRDWWNDPYREKPKWTDRSIAFLTFGIVALAYMQWREMHDSGTQTDRIIAADERIAKAMEGVVGQAQTALNASIEASRTDQRAWVGVIEVATPTDLRQGTVLNSTVIMSNEGKTPAYNLVQRAGFRIVRNGDRFDPAHEVAVSLPHKQGILMPRGKHELPITGLGAIGSQRAEELNSGEYRLFMFGQIAYDDAFGRHHETRFCMVMGSAAPHGFSPYGDYDYAN